MILLLIGRSGSGKSAIAKILREKHGYAFVRTATTRKRRQGETEDAYYFMTKAEFHEREKAGYFAEWDVYNDNCYGTPKPELEKDANQVIVITPEGAENIKKVFPDAFVVHVVTDLKTSAIRAIKREDDLTPASLQQIAIRGTSDEYLYRNMNCDYSVENPEGADLDDIAERITKSHNDWKQWLEA